MPAIDTEENTLRKKLKKPTEESTPFYPTPTGQAPTQKNPVGSNFDLPPPSQVSSSSSQKGVTFADPRKSVQELTRLANELETGLMSQGNREEDITELRKAIADAKQERDSATSRNEWAQVAQTLATAVTQAAASQAGGGKYNMSNLPIGQVDYDKRSDGARSNYKSAVEAAGDINKAKDQQRSGLTSALTSGYKAKALPYEEELKGAREAQRSDAQMGRYATMERDRDGRAASAADQRNREAEARSLETQAKESLARSKAIDTLSSNQSLMDQISSKSGDKLQASMGKEFGAAGLTVQDLEATDAPGMLWGTNPDPKARAAKLQEAKQKAVAEYRNLLDAAKNLRRQGAPQNATVQSDSSGGLVTFRHKSGAEKAVTPEQAAVLRQNPDFTEIK